MPVGPRRRRSVSTSGPALTEGVRHGRGDTVCPPSHRSRGSARTDSTSSPWLPDTSSASIRPAPTTDPPPTRGAPPPFIITFLTRSQHVSHVRFTDLPAHALDLDPHHRLRRHRPALRHPRDR